MVTQSQMAPDTPELVRDAQAGDTGALDELVAAHLPLVYNIVGRALAGHPDVDDLVQETMLRAIRGLPTLREPDRFRSWLVTIAYRQIQLYLRSRRASRQRHTPEPVEVADPRGDFADRTAAEIVVADQRRELVEAARWLDDADRRLLGLWWQEASGDLTRTELAAALAVQPKHAAVRVQRMKAQLEAARGVVRALRARPRCPELSGRLRRWNGVADPLWRKRLVRHVRDCPQCGTRRGGLVAPEELLLGIAALAVPAGLAATLKAAVPAKAAVFPKLVALAAATTAVVGGGVAYTVYQQNLPPGTGDAIVAPAPTRSALPGTAQRIRPSSPTARPQFLLAGVETADIYVAPGGSDTADGSLAHPYATLGKAVSVVRPGQTIAMRGGTYRPAGGVTIATSGTATRRIVLSGYRNEHPVIDASGVPASQWPITQRGAYWTVQGLEVKNSRSHAYVCGSCRDMIFRRLVMHDNARSGLMLRDPGTTGNQVLDSDFYRNRSAGAGIGLGVQFGDGAGNVLRGNRAFDNGTAGFDLGDFASPVTLDRNWSYANGTNGFALAGGSPPVTAAHRLRDNAAWNNAGHGFTDDGAGAPLRLTSNTAYANGGTGFALPHSAATLTANAAAANAVPATLAASAHASRNSWQLSWWSAGAFRSTESAVAEANRRPDGTLPRTAFLSTTDGIGASMSD